MRGFDYYLNKLFEYRIHQSLERATKDVRIAMTELNDDNDKFKILIRLTTLISPRYIINDILLIICAKPDEIVFSDVVMAMLCLCSSYIVVYPYPVNVILSKFSGVLRTPFWTGGYNPLSNICYGSNRVYELDMIKVLVRHGIEINFVLYNTALEEGKVSIADYFLEQGLVVLSKIYSNHNHDILIRKRRACRDAVMAVFGVFLKRCRFNKNVASNIVKPLVWKTRLEPQWDLATPPSGGLQHKKRK